MALWRREAQTIKNNTPSHQINNDTQVKDTLNLKGYQNCIIGSKVTTIWLGGCFFFLLVELYGDGSAINRATPSRNIMLQLPVLISVERITHGVLQSPGFPEMFKSNSDKEYRIQVPKGKVVHIQFSEFSLDNRDPCQDYVKIVDNNRRLLLPPTCGKKLPSEILSHTNRVSVFFHSGTTSQWRLNWKESKKRA